MSRTKGLSVSSKIKRCFDVGDNKFYEAIIFKHVLKEYLIFSESNQTGLSKQDVLKADADFFKASEDNLLEAKKLV